MPVHAESMIEKHILTLPALSNEEREGAVEAHPHPACLIERRERRSCRSASSPCLPHRTKREKELLTAPAVVEGSHR